MGKKAKSDVQRIIAYGMNATADQLNTAIESLQAVRDARFAAATKPPRKPRSDVGSTRKAANEPQCQRLSEPFKFSVTNYADP